jgi:PIN domain nuclease of toxin-antitoxin system
VKLLLDTHVFLWLNAAPERLGGALAEIEDSRNRLVVSAASSWEIAIKHARGRLPLPDPPERYVPDLIRRIGAQALTIEHAHALGVSSLPPLHRDPFDRLLVAQARSIEATLVTADERLAEYPVRTLVV